MKGTLWKWTNYWNGWQPRWFVLENGILAYYTTQEEANQGSKGSMKISVCDIVSHPTDNTRLDLIIHGEQHFYLKAATAKERQMWIVALGTAKAAQSNQRKKKKSKAKPDDLKSKKSELRLYCDLLMQQVHSVKNIVTSSSPPDVEKLSNATNLLEATCDTFIHTLESCMKLSDVASHFSTPCSEFPEGCLPAVPSQLKMNLKTGSSVKHSVSGNDKCKVQTEVFIEKSAERNFDMNHTQVNKEKILKINFDEVIIEDELAIDTISFLESCKTIMIIFDVLGSHIFAPVKSDILGNIVKLSNKYIANPVEYKSLQKIILAEINQNSTQESGSATDALLWLTRALCFILELMIQLTSSKDELTTCIHTAYGKTLQKHHGMIVRGIFSLALKAVPYRRDFITKLLANNLEYNVEAESQLLLEANDLIMHLQKIVNIIEVFYRQNNLEF